MPERDIREEQLAELQAEIDRLRAAAAEARRVKDDFLATLSHELRTPLNALLGWIQLLRLHINDPGQREHALEVLERNARHQVQIVNDLLDVSRAVTGQMRVTFERVDLTTIARDATLPLAAAAAAKHITLVFELAPIAGTVYGDPARLRQVVWNLVSNAVKFTTFGGSVMIKTRERPGSAELEVSDTGIGIPPADLPSVFDRFHQGDSSLTRPYGGLGLGLAIVKHLVELHGGTVEADSRGPGHGSTFRVRLPIAEAHHSA